MITLLLLCYYSYKDIRFYELSKIDMWIMYALILFHFIFDSITLIDLAVILLFLIFYLLSKNKIGGADIKIFIYLYLVFKFDVLFIMMISAFLGIIFILLTKKKKIPFIPFITVGVLILMILS